MEIRTGLYVLVFVLSLYLTFGAGFSLATFLLLFGRRENKQTNFIFWLSCLFAWPWVVYEFRVSNKRVKDKTE